jgi:hypothetical protein
LNNGKTTNTYLKNKMKMKQIIVSLLLVICAGILHAQDTTMVLHRDSRLDVLTKKQGEINKTSATAATMNVTSSGQVKGYRIMVLNSTDRELAYKTKGMLLSRFGGHGVYLSYQAPFFKLKIGDFYAKGDAEDLKRQVATLMTKGVYVVPDIIKLRPEDERKYFPKPAEDKDKDK